MINNDERLAMMRDLHDTVTHCLSTVALQMMVAEAQPHGPPRALTEIRHLVQESLTILGLMEKLLQSANAPPPQLNVSALWWPTVAAHDMKLTLDRAGAEVGVSVPREADQLEVASRYVLVLALNLARDHIKRHVSAGHNSDVEISVSTNVVQCAFRHAPGTSRAPLPPPSPRSINSLRARAELVGGRVIVESDPNERCWGLILTLARTTWSDTLDS